MAPSNDTASFFRKPHGAAEGSPPPKHNLFTSVHPLKKKKSPQALPCIPGRQRGRGAGDRELGLRFTRASRAEQGCRGSETENKTQSLFQQPARPPGAPGSSGLPSPPRQLLWASLPLDPS